MATTVPGPVERHDNDWTSAETAAGRNVGLSLWRSVRGRCPRCGPGRLFCAFLRVDDHCSVCRLNFTGHRADDLPAYLVIVIVGHGAIAPPTGYAYLVTCHDVVKDAAGRAVELRCAYDPDSRGGAGAGGRKVGATIHWVSAVDALPAEVRLYGRLFSAASPSPTDLAADLDPHSMQMLSGCLVERATASCPHGPA